MGPERKVRGVGEVVVAEVEGAQVGEVGDGLGDGGGARVLDGVRREVEDLGARMNYSFENKGQLYRKCSGIANIFMQRSALMQLAS